MPALRFDMAYPQQEGFTRQLVRGIDLWTYTLPLRQPGQTAYAPPIARRVDNDAVNATRLVALCGLSASQRAKELGVRPHQVIRGGLNNLQGTWVPLERARELARKYSIEHLVAPILFDPKDPPTVYVDERAKGTTAQSYPASASTGRGRAGTSGAASGSSQGTSKETSRAKARARAVAAAAPPKPREPRPKRTSASQQQPLPSSSPAHLPPQPPAAARGGGGGAPPAALRTHGTSPLALFPASSSSSSRLSLGAEGRAGAGRSSNGGVVVDGGGGGVGNGNGVSPGNRVDVGTGPSAVGGLGRAAIKRKRGGDASGSGSGSGSSSSSSEVARSVSAVGAGPGTSAGGAAGARRGQTSHPEITSWTSRAHGGDLNGTAGWLALHPPSTSGSATASVSLTNGAGAGSGSVGGGVKTRGSNGVGLVGAGAGANTGSSTATGLPSSGVSDRADSLTPRSPTLHELRNILRKGTGVKSGEDGAVAGMPALPAGSNRSSLRVVLPSGSAATIAGASSGAGPMGPSNGHQEAAKGEEAFSPDENGSGLAGIASAYRYASINGSAWLGPATQHLPTDPLTWDSATVAAYGRTRGWDEARIIAPLQAGDIDGPLLLSLDYNDASIFVLNNCGIGVPGDRVRVIQGACHLRELYPAAAERLLVGGKMLK